MIIKRLYELAERENMLADPAFEDLPIPLVIVVRGDGEFVDIRDTRTSVDVAAKGGTKKRLDNGKVLSVPKAHGNTASGGFARFFADTLPRVLPISDEKKSVASRATFWLQMDHAATESGDPALGAICKFGRRFISDSDLVQRLAAEVSKLAPGAGARCTFAIYEDVGLTILEREPVRKWWRHYFVHVAAQRQEAGPRGLCQITGEKGSIATVHGTKISGITGGSPMGACLVSGDKDAFESYGLSHAANANIGYRAAEGYTRSLQALLKETLGRTKVTVGGTTFLFWGKDQRAIGDITSVFDSGDPGQIAHLLKSPHAGSMVRALDKDAFYCLVLSANAARIVVRDYLETPLDAAVVHLQRWFDDLQIIEPSGHRRHPRFPLWQIALATADMTENVSPTVGPQLLLSALSGRPIGDHMLAACIRRLQAEGTGAFNPVRLGLVKLLLIRRSIPMTESLQLNGSPAYICGRLLAVFEQAQWGALGDVNATVVDRYYSTASASPGLVLPRLFRSAAQHISKLESDKPGMAENIKKELEALCASLTEIPHTLPLEQQGEFALGFYHQRAEFRHRAAERIKEKGQAAAK